MAKPQYLLFLISHDGACAKIHNKLKHFFKRMSPTLIFKSFTELGIPEIYTILFIIVIYYLIIKKI